MTDLSTIISDLREATEDGRLRWTRDDQTFRAEVAGIRFNVWYDDESETPVLGMVVHRRLVGRLPF